MAYVWNIAGFVPGVNWLVPKSTTPAVESPPPPPPQSLQPQLPEISPTSQSQQLEPPTIATTIAGLVDLPVPQQDPPPVAAASLPPPPETPRAQGPENTDAGISTQSYISSPAGNYHSFISFAQQPDLEPIPTMSTALLHEHYPQPQNQQPHEDQVQERPRMGLAHLVFLIPAWAIQLFICSLFAAWMSIQFALMRGQRDPKFLDALPVFVLIVSSLFIITFIMAEMFLFILRGTLDEVTFQRLQFAKLGASTFGWFGLFLAALLDDSKGDSTHVRWTEVLVGLGGVALLQIPWLITLAYACSVRFVHILSARWEKNIVDNEAANLDTESPNRRRWSAVVWPFVWPKQTYPHSNHSDTPDERSSLLGDRHQ